ncbi:MAG: family 43 glycosylhydrolase [Bacilli bacterium]|jgi:hypothetical protein
MMKKIKPMFMLMLTASLLGCTTPPAAPFYAPFDQVMKWFDHGTFGESRFYNYCPSTFIEDGERYVYYCTNKVEGNITDYIGYHHGVYSKDQGWDWGEMSLVLGPTAGTWDQRHTCDPSVVKGEFTYQGEEYHYLMAFLGSIQSDNNGNETGLAVSKTPNGPFIKCDDINPIVPYDRENAIWGTGQASLVNIDQKGNILMFYSVGNKDGTYEEVREYDFSNLDEPVLINHAKVPTNGLLSGDNLICDADICYDVANKKLLMVKGKIPYSPDRNAPAFIASSLVVYYLDLSASAKPTDEVFKGTNAKNWRLVAEIGYEETGFMRNHNAGLVTDEYGHLLQDTDFIEIALTRSDLGNNEWAWLSTYRIYSISRKLPYLEE